MNKDITQKILLENGKAIGDGRATQSFRGLSDDACEGGRA